MAERSGEKSGKSGKGEKLERAAKRERREKTESRAENKHSKNGHANGHAQAAVTTLDIEASAPSQTSSGTPVTSVASTRGGRAARTTAPVGGAANGAINIELLRRLSETPGVAGREERVRALVIEQLTPLVDELSVDALGNVIAFKRGSADLRVMLAAHMDEIGFMVR